MSNHFPTGDCPKTRRGFASMDQQTQRLIASKGGRAAHAKGTAHEFTTEEAAAAGRKGGVSVSRNREYMAEIGRRGGLTKKHNAAIRKAVLMGPGPITKPTGATMDWARQVS